MARKWIALGLLVLVAGSGCNHCRERHGLLARLRGHTSSPNYEPNGASPFQPCGCERDMGGPVIYDGGITRPPNVMETTPGGMPNLIAPPNTTVPNDQAKPMPADPSKAGEMSRPKTKANPF